MKKVLAALARLWRMLRGSRAPGRFFKRSFSNAAGTRAYKVYLPAGYSGQAMPLVVMLHGCKQSPDEFALGTGMNRLADELGFIVVYPAQAWTANYSKCWNWFRPRDQQRDAGEPSLIAGITRQVVSRYNVNRRRVYVAGLSAGGAMAAIMAATYPDLYAAAGVHSGLPYASARDAASAVAAMRGVRAPGAALPSLPTIVFHGDRDGTVHHREGDYGSAGIELRTEKGEAGGRQYTRTFFGNGKSWVEHWLVHGAGHAWYGGNPEADYADAKGPDAAREMLRFFLESPAPTRI